MNYTYIVLCTPQRKVVRVRLGSGNLSQAAILNWLKTG